jgi:hypothetical protein
VDTAQEWPRITWALVLGAGLVAVDGCRLRHSIDASVDSGAPSVAVVPSSSAADPAADLHAPPAMAPADAMPLPHGAHWRIAHPGAGAAPGPDDRVHAKLSVWRHDGSIAYTTRGRGDGTLPFAIAGVPHDLTGALTQLAPGAVAQFWLPREFVEAAGLEGHKPPFIPIDDVTIEYELVTFDAPPSGASPPAPASEGRVPAQERPPDAAGPPLDAFSVNGGIRYIVVARGAGAVAAGPDVRIDMSIALWQVDGLLVSGPARRMIATTPSRAPAGLSRLLLGAREGDAFRIWLPLAQAKEAFPGLAEHESVCDLTVDGVAR